MNNFIDQVSIDCVVFGYHSKSLKVLISKIALVEDTFALPGGFIHQNEDIDEAAQRILRERTSINKIYLEQFKVFGNSNRGDDQFISKFKESIFYQKHRSDLNIDLEWLKKRFISVGYYAIVDVEKVVLRASEIDERIDWINIDKIPSLIFDHNDIINEALIALREKFDKKLIGFKLLPDTFTMREIQELYEVIYNTAFARNNFQKRILDLNVLDRLEKKYTGAAHKAPYLYKFRQ